MTKTAERPTLTADNNGRSYVKLSQLRVDSMIELDGDFTCADAGPVRVLHDGDGFYFICKDGHHYLAGQADDREHCVGVYISEEW